MVHRHVSDEVKEMALAMSLQGLQDSEVCKFTGISVRCIRHARSTYRQTGAVSRKAFAPGHPRTLTSVHRQVRLFIHSLD